MTDSYSEFQWSCTLATLMVLGVMSNEGDVMSPHSFIQGLKVNAAEEMLVRIVRSWIESVSKERSYTCQQDSALFHKFKMTQKWMSYNVHDPVTPNIFPLSFPHLNLLAYVWGILEREVYQCAHLYYYKSL